jgi:hypothetical protein
MIGKPAQQFEERDPDATEQGRPLEEVRTQHGGIVDPTRFLEIGDAFPYINTVLAQQEGPFVLPRRQATNETRITCR